MKNGMSQNESKWCGYSWEWDWMKPMNHRPQWMAILHSQGAYDVHVVIGKGTKPDSRYYSPLIGKTGRQVEDKRERP